MHRLRMMSAALSMKKKENVPYLTTKKPAPKAPAHNPEMAASHNHEHILKEPHNTGRRSGSARCEVLGVTFRNENLFADHECFESSESYLLRVKVYSCNWSYSPALTTREGDANADKVMEFDVNSIPYTEEAYKQKKYAFVSDYARFWIMYHYGGIYFDTDVEVIRRCSKHLSQWGSPSSPWSHALMP